MIGLSRPRPVRLALVAALILAVTCAATPGGGEPLAATTFDCTSSGSFDEIWIDCGADTAEMKAGALTAEEARSIGCPPIFWEGVDRDEAATPDTQPEPEPTGVEVPERTPDPAVAARVDRAWDRIERWLGTHASVTLRKLNFGRDPQSLTRIDNGLPHRLPDDLFASYLRHDGAEGNFGRAFRLPSGYGLAPISDFDSFRFGHCEDLVIGGDLAKADPERGSWHGAFVGIGTDGHDHDLFVDPRTGRVGEAVYGERVRYDGPMGWPSFVAMLEAVADALETGRPLRSWYPVVSGCELRWAREPAPLPTGCSGPPRPSPTPTPEPTPEGPTAAEIRASGCRPARRAPVVRMPDPRTAAKVNAVWRRIERWLAREAPVTYKRLRPPARPRAIAAAEAATGLRFPDDLRASLLRHDGAEFLGFGPPPFFHLISARQIRAEWKMLCGILLDGPAEGIGYWWDGHLIPFADSHDGGNLFIDTRTGETGEYFNETGLDFEGDQVWPSYLAVLRATARSLETGKPLRGWRPEVRKGELEWERS